MTTTAMNTVLTSMPNLKVRRIGVLTGGGDCPGLNAVIRAITKTAIYQHNVRVFGIEDGYLGLIEGRVGELSSMHVSGILTRGGTILGSNNKVSPTHYFTGYDENNQPRIENRTNDCLRTVEEHQLDALVVVGGDGTMTCTAPLIEAGVPCVGVPKTIDNDIVGTDITFGFITASDTATRCLDRLHSTAASHHRVMVCEIMGRNAGWLALHSGIASGADVILIPEIPFEIDAICDFVLSRQSHGRGFSIVACAEGARPAGGQQIVATRDETSPEPVRLGGIGEHVATLIKERAKIETRFNVLGHIVRGGDPVPRDRVLASLFGHRAMDMLMAGHVNQIVVMRDGKLGAAGILNVANKQRTVPMDEPLLDVARSVRTCLGDRSTY